MGKKAKIGKNRQDKFYHLAKEQGFRSRAAFKLVQLNKRHDFLSSAARGVLDLCAAPGGWMQVARKHMPLGAPCIGIDLFPIRAVPGCVAITGDITAENTRGEIRRSLNEAGTGDKVDVVLNDGSPNMGKAWLQDAYTQSELTLAALKLATDFLAQGGTFVTKVFRSNDYNSLLFVMHQLFNRVNATKPTASRNESAEIYVMCIGYKAPKSIDPRLLNPKYVFKDLSAEDFNDNKKDNKPDLFLNTVLKDLKKQKRNRDGYKDGEVTFFKKVSVLELCQTQRPVALLVDSSQFSFEPRLMVDLGVSEADAKRIARLLENLEDTTSEFLSCCEDLKVLARREFKLILKWRANARKALLAANLLDINTSKIGEGNDDMDDKGSTEEPNPDVSNDDDGSDNDMEDSDENEEAFDEEVDKARAEAMAVEKRKRRKANKIRNALQRKIDMKIILPDEEGAATHDTSDALFALKTAERAARHGADMDDVPVDVADIIIPEEEEDEDGYEGDNEVVGTTIEGEKILKRRRKANKLEDPKLAINNEADEIEKSLDRWYKSYIKQKKVDKNGLVLKEAKERKRITKRRAIREAQEKQNEQDENGNDDYDENVNVKLVVDSSESSEEEKVKDDTDDSDDEGDAEFGLTSKQSREAALWFSQPLFDGVDDELSDEDEQCGDIAMSKGADVFGSGDVGNTEDFHTAAQMEAERIVEQRNQEKEEEGDGFEVVAQEAEQDKNEDMDDDDDGDEKEGEESDSSFHSSDYDTDEKAEMMAIGREMKRSKHNTEDMLDEGYHRYTFDDPLELPRWFADQDGEYRERSMPVSKEQVEEMKSYIKSLAAAPTKKEAEAKARRRLRLEKKMEAMKSKANNIAEQTDLSVNSRMKAIEDVYKQAMKSGKSGPKKKKKVYQVLKPTGKMIVGKNAGKGRAGMKGARLTLVDRRMKSDKRGIQKAERKRNGAKSKKG